MWEELAKFLRDIIKANDNIEDVYLVETEKFTGDPFVTLTPSGNESDFDTTTENGRAYGFMLRIFNERGGEVSIENAEEAMRILVDSVLDDLDKNWDLSGLATPAGYSFLYMEAAPSAWGYIDREVSHRVAEINIRCHFEIDTELIT